MKKNLNVSILAVTVLLMSVTACTSDESIEKTYTPEPVNFGVSIGTPIMTRAGSPTATTAWGGTIEEKFASGDVVAIYTTDADDKWYKKSYATSAASASANAATALTVGTSAADVFYWKGTTDKKKFHAYSFGNSTAISNTAAASGDATDDFHFETNNAFTVPTDQQSGSNYEFLYSYGYIPYSTAAKTIVLNHQLTRIDLELVTEKQDTELDATKSVKIGSTTSGKGVTVVGTFTPASSTEFTALVTAGTEDLGSGHNGAWTLSTTSTDIDKEITPRVISGEAAVSPATTPATYTTTYSAVLLPQDFTGKDMFVISYDGATYKYTGVAADNLSSGIGKKYTYKIEISADKLNVTQVQIAAWDAVNQGTVSAPLQ